MLILQGVFAQLSVMSDKHVVGLCGGQSSLLRDPASDRILNRVDATLLSLHLAAVMVAA